MKKLSLQPPFSEFDFLEKDLAVQLGKRRKAKKAERMATLRCLPPAFSQLLRRAHLKKSLGFKATHKSPAYLQRCSVRMTFAKNMSDNRWRAFGHYMAREGANTPREKAKGFGNQGEMDIAKTLNDWENAGDKHLFKLIISPEFGDKINLSQLTKDYIKKLSKDLNTSLEWIAIDHYNTAHPHVHVAIRGIDSQGNTLHIPKHYVRTTLRLRAQEVCTAQLGYRTLQQVEMAWKQQISQSRLTDIDRILLKRAEKSEKFLVKLEKGKKQDHLLEKRLQHLKAWGLASYQGSHTWQLHPNFKSALQHMQIAHDRLKLMHRHQAYLSDKRLQIQGSILGLHQRIEGRLIAQGLEESREMPWLMVEGIDGVVHYISQPMRVAQSLKLEDFIQLEGKLRTGKTNHLIVEVKSLGNAKALLNNKQHFIEATKHYQKLHKAIPFDKNFSGWLGQYHQCLQAVYRKHGHSVGKKKTHEH